MPLLGRMFRTAAVTGSADVVASRIAGRQGGAWAERTISAALPPTMRAPHAGPPPPARPRVDPQAALRTLDELRRRGIVTDDEAQRLRARLPAPPAGP